MADRPGGDTPTPPTYEQLGVSATKAEVHAAAARTDPGLYPGAFCRLTADLFGDDPAWCAALHADGAGTKTLVAYLMYRETGNPAVFSTLAQDALVMNLDDLCCVGAVDRFLLANTIARNSRYIPGEVLTALIDGFERCLAWLGGLGVRIKATGGETADLVDIVRTLTVDATLAVRLPRADVVDNSRITAGQAIVGVSSTGQATYEPGPNSGIGSNGLTLARHVLLSPHYRDTYPETVAPELDPAVVYRGRHRLADEPAGLGLSVGAALLSPTRTYLPVVRSLLAELGVARVAGLVHNTGGGLTKSGRFGGGGGTHLDVRGLDYRKTDLFPCPPLFRLIAGLPDPAAGPAPAEPGAAAVTPWEMCRTFNMGHRLEVYVDPADAGRVIRVAADWGLDAKVIGEVADNPAGPDNVVTVHFAGETLSYEAG